MAINAFCRINAARSSGSFRILSEVYRLKHYDPSRANRCSSSSSRFGFAFDIDGVLCRSNEALPGAKAALQLLEQYRVPFILLTNGGGKTERARADQLSNILDAPISTANFVQSHTPFASFSHLKDKTALVMGGPRDGHSCRLVAESYGFGTVVTPLDIYAAYPDIWPFGPDMTTRSKEHIRPLPLPLAPPHAVVSELDSRKHLKIDAALVFNDPRQWSLDCSVLLDTLLSCRGFIGTLSGKNGDLSLANRGYLQDDQPKLYYSNPDVFWAAHWSHPRLGQGAFRAAFEGVWRVATNGAELSNFEQWGKPHTPTYQFAETRLAALVGDSATFDEGRRPSLTTVYMIGDNPESDIAGANNFKSLYGTDWRSILVRSGVYISGKPSHEPRHVVDGVLDAVRLAFQEQGYKAF